MNTTEYRHELRHLILKSIANDCKLHFTGVDSIRIDAALNIANITLYRYAPISTIQTIRDFIITQLEHYGFNISADAKDFSIEYRVWQNSIIFII